MCIRYGFLIVMLALNASYRSKCLKACCSSATLLHWRGSLTLKPQVVPVRAGLYPASFGVRLQHMADAVVELEAVSDASSVTRLVPDSAR